MGASAGGVEALRNLVTSLPADLEAVCVVLHTSSDSVSNLPTILDRAGPLSAKHARDGDPLAAGAQLVQDHGRCAFEIELLSPA